MYFYRTNKLSFSFIFNIQSQTIYFGSMRSLISFGNPKNNEVNLNWKGHLSYKYLLITIKVVKCEIIELFGLYLR